MHTRFGCPKKSVVDKLGIRPTMNKFTSRRQAPTGSTKDVDVHRQTIKNFLDNLSNQPEYCDPKLDAERRRLQRPINAKDTSPMAMGFRGKNPKLVPSARLRAVESRLGKVLAGEGEDLREDGTQKTHQVVLLVSRWKRDNNGEGEIIWKNRDGETTNKGIGKPVLEFVAEGNDWGGMQIPRITIDSKRVEYGKLITVRKAMEMAWKSKDVWNSSKYGDGSWPTDFNDQNATLIYKLRSGGYTYEVPDETEDLYDTWTLVSFHDMNDTVYGGKVSAFTDVVHIRGTVWNSLQGSNYSPEANAVCKLYGAYEYPAVKKH